MLDQSALGQRVVVRFRSDAADPNSPARDVTGVLESLDAHTVTLRGKAGSVAVAVSDVLLARVVAPAARDVLALQRTASLGWRAAEVADLDGWQLRANHGWTRRANSALPLSGATRALPLLLDKLVEWYRSRALEPLVQVPMPARGLLDAELDRRGWAAECPAIVLTRVIESGVAPPAGVVMSSSPSADWLAAHADSSDAAVALLKRHPAVIFASVAINGKTVAIARGAVDEGWLGISALSVAPGSRRHGLASALITALIAGAHAEHGATQCYLQVEEANHGAIELCRRLDFKPHHRYVYRRMTRITDAEK